MTNNAQLSTSLQPLPTSWVERMFDKMLLDFGKKFVDQWSGTDPDKLIAHWAHEMADYSGAEIKRGLSEMEQRDWPPSLPEFKKMCRPPVDILKAYYEAVYGMQARERGEMGEWSSPAVYWAAVKIGAFDLKNQPYAQIKVRWDKALQDVLDAGSYLPIPVPMIALPEPGKGHLSAEDAAKRLQELGASAALKPKTNHRAWATRIIEEEKHKPGTWPSYSVRCAKEAMKAIA